MAQGSCEGGVGVDEVLIVHEFVGDAVKEPAGLSDDALGSAPAVLLQGHQVRPEDAVEVRLQQVQLFPGAQQPSGRC